MIFFHTTFQRIPTKIYDKISQNVCNFLNQKYLIPVQSTVSPTSVHFSTVQLDVHYESSVFVQPFIRPRHISRSRRCNIKWKVLIGFLQCKISANSVRMFDTTAEDQFPAHAKLKLKLKCDTRRFFEFRTGEGGQACVCVRFCAFVNFCCLCSLMFHFCDMDMKLFL